MSNNHQSLFNSPCAACKFLRRKCTPDCIFAPYFPPNQPQKFAFVHRVYGASNVAKMLSAVSQDQRDDVVNSLAYEAEARLRDPVYGCVGFIATLQRQLNQLQTDINIVMKELSTYSAPDSMASILQPRAVASCSSSVNQLQPRAGIPMQNPQPLIVESHQPSTWQFYMAAAGPSRNRSHETFPVKGEQNELTNNSTGSVCSYGCNPMKTTIVPSAPPSSSFQGTNYQIQPAQQSEGRISNSCIPHQFQQQFLAQPRPATAEQQTQQPQTSLMLQNAPKHEACFHN